MFPEAPESTIMKIGLLASKLASMALATSLDALVQMSTSSSRRSSSVIRPISACDWIFAAFSSYLLRISLFESGVATSSIETVTPECVAQ